MNKIIKALKRALIQTILITIKNPFMQKESKMITLISGGEKDEKLEILTDPYGFLFFLTQYPYQENCLPPPQ